MYKYFSNLTRFTQKKNMKLDSLKQEQPFLADDSVGTLLLPKDKFSFWITYAFSEHMHQLASKIWGGLAILLAVLTITFGILGNDISIAFFIFSLFSLLFFLILFAVNCERDHKLYKLNSHNKMKLLMDIIENKPNASVQSWDIIARHMNKYLYLEGYYNTPNFFYDGNEVYYWFRRFVLEARMAPQQNIATTTQNSSSVADSKDGVKELDPNIASGTSPELAVLQASRIAASNLADRTELGKYEIVALQVYEESVAEYWANEYPVAFERVENFVDTTNTGTSKQDTTAEYADMV
ncbi:uncharacterized protein NDAI_0G02310 [Naumovozyma dairenensis CBS 421]|uniref:Uncharacterized protein n=1 Tax=Naumovozyma dairenensis (strain ATCC 10597 / BCRC 20456 / CBS 421 / NBRC 0211 / NRRL Y-12639) TaxID=1071378 RepID=G0WDZ5_NAUDC|nr:hypothetical protein NDAI_0G02310 [Naumovozyma dairenensis CBS 421]CCD26006.2 hypothetical protein NDAI_0G02310 [Naumovozyma dairenensis CBS 421]